MKKKVIGYGYKFSNESLNQLSRLYELKSRMESKEMALKEMKVAKSLNKKAKLKLVRLVLEEV